MAAIGSAAPTEWAPRTGVVVCHTLPAGPSGLCCVTSEQFRDFDFCRQTQRTEPSLVLGGHGPHPRRYFDKIGRTLALNLAATSMPCDLVNTYWAIDTDVRTAELRRADKMLMTVDG